MKVDKKKITENFEPVQLILHFETQEEFDYIEQLLLGITTPGFIESALAAVDTDNLTEEKVNWLSQAVNLIRNNLMR